MDNEADELENSVRRASASRSDPALRSTLDRYQMGDLVMHKEPCSKVLSVAVFLLSTCS